jgi:hypothetical protein
MTRPPHHRRRRQTTPPPPPTGGSNGDNSDPAPTDKPVFAQPQPTPDPTQFRIPHPSDAQAYAEIDALNRDHKLGPLPSPRGLPEPRLTLAEVLGPSGDDVIKKITETGRLVFHSVGDTGAIKGPDNQSLVADKMTADFEEEVQDNIPRFFFHLGDVIYNFGEREYYYDQFYEPYRDYPAPIVALAGNHDGMVAPSVTVPTLAAFLDNFCAEHFEVRPEAGGLSRTAQIQPGVFFTFEAPMLRIVALYSNVLEDPGVIASDELGDSQLQYLKAALGRVASDKFSGALIIAHHHPAYTVGSKHGWSEAMRKQIDAICADAKVWPHAVLSAHAHNYQRFTRVHENMEVPYIVAGNGGHAVARLKRAKQAGGQPTHSATRVRTDAATRYETPFRAPTVLETAGGGEDLVRLENYDDQDFGYLRAVVTSEQLRIEYHPASDTGEAKTPDDIVAVDLKTRKLAVPKP